MTLAAVELAYVGEAQPDPIIGASALRSAPIGGGFSRQYLQGIACAVYVGIANGSFLVTNAHSLLPRAWSMAIRAFAPPVDVPSSG